MIQVTARNGQTVPFDLKRITAAVDKAFLDIKGSHMPQPLGDILASHFEEAYGPDGTVGVERIQDDIEQLLMEQEYLDVARGYIVYREKHRGQRMLRDRIRYMDEYARSSRNAASSSETDANANVALKNVANLNGEVYKSVNRQIQRLRMEKKLKAMFPEVEKQYVKDLEHHIIYTHDESSTPVVEPYCYAVSLYPFMTEGTGGLDGLEAGAPRGLASFAGQFCNLAFLLAAQCKGAVAFGEFFIAFAWYCRKDYGEGWWRNTGETVSLKPHRTMREAIRQYFQQIIYTLNQPAGNRCYQSPFTNISYYDRNYFDALFGEFRYPDCSQPQWEAIDWLQKEFLEWFNKERTRCLLTFPVETMALLSDGQDIIDKDYKALTARMYARGHSFFTYISDNPDSLSSCCRLRNRITDNTFSFTNGLTGVQTGSANVITLNLNRIVQDWARSQGLSREMLKGRLPLYTGSLKAYLEEILERVYKYHTAYKTLLYEMEDSGMLTPSNAGYISMRRLYSTIGENGLNEAAEFLGLECHDNDGYRDFCRLITGTISTRNAAHSTKDLMFNQEFVPAESLSSKNCNWDREEGYWVPEGRILYNSYFYKADDPETSVLEKFRLHGRAYTGLLDGGVGLHCNLSEHLSERQYSHLIETAVSEGTSYFTFNVPNSRCVNGECRHIVKLPMDTCPRCGSPMEQYTRIIGYLVKVNNFDAHRKAEALTRHYHEPKKEQTC